VNTASRYRLSLGDGASIVVNRINGQPGAIFSDVGGWRRAYGYTIRWADGALVVRGRDLHGPCGAYTDAEAPTAHEMMASLLSHLGAAAEHYHFQVMHLHTPLDSDDPRISSYRPRFSASADEWAYLYDDELAVAHLDLTTTPGTDCDAPQGERS
jgi:hypothetical protein